MASLTVNCSADTVYIGFAPPDVTADDVKAIVLVPELNMIQQLTPILTVTREGEETTEGFEDVNQNNPEWFG